MILASDVPYQGDAHVLAAGLSFADWPAPGATGCHRGRVDGIAPYRPGAFHRRDRPGLPALPRRIGTSPEGIVIDGHVTRGTKERAAPGPPRRAILWRGAIAGAANPVPIRAQGGHKKGMGHLPQGLT